MAKVLISSLARKDLQETADYIANQLHNQGTAKKIVERIKGSVFQLSDFPEMGTPILPHRQGIAYRYLICGSYMIFYHVEKDVVHIDRILYGRRDYLVRGGADRAEEHAGAGADAQRPRCHRAGGERGPGAASRLHRDRAPAVGVAAA